MHEGHRQRLFGRLRGGDNLYEHELLEMLLFNAYPRKDVAPLAHALLERFASIKGVLEASLEELCAIEGIGENIALYLKCVERCVQMSNNCEYFGVVKNTPQFIEFISPRFRGKTAEEVEFYFIDRVGRVKSIARYTSGDETCVEMSTAELNRLITNYHTYGVFIAHNHINCSTAPSQSDDILTRQIEIMCSINDMVLLDHCIYSDCDEAYSYFLNGRMQEIRKHYNITDLSRTPIVD